MLSLVVVVVVVVVVVIFFGVVYNWPANPPVVVVPPVVPPAVIPAPVGLGPVLGAVGAGAIPVAITFADHFIAFRALDPLAQQSICTIMRGYRTLPFEVKFSVKDILQDYHQVTKEASRPFANMFNGYGTLEPKAKGTIDTIIHEYNTLDYSTQRSLSAIIQAMFGYDVVNDRTPRTIAEKIRYHDAIGLNEAAGTGLRPVAVPTASTVSPTGVLDNLLIKDKTFPLLVGLSYLLLRLELQLSKLVLISLRVFLLLHLQSLQFASSSLQVLPLILFIDTGPYPSSLTM